MTNNVIKKYPDGTGYIDINNENYSNFTYKINSYEDLWYLGHIIETINHNGVKPIVTIPCLLDAQADRRFSKTQSSGLKMVCKFLNQFDVLKYRIFHPHNPEVVEAMLNNVEIIDNSIFITKVLKSLLEEKFQQTSNESNLILMASDAGGFKGLSKLCDKLFWKDEIYSASKARKWDNNIGTSFIQQIDREDFKGKNILIIDDICVYGGTFKGIANLLKEKNVGKLYLAVSHITIQNHKNNELFKLYDKVFVTNSKFDNYFIPQEGGVKPENLEIIKLF